MPDIDYNPPPDIQHRSADKPAPTRASMIDSLLSRYSAEASEGAPKQSASVSTASVDVNAPGQAEQASNGQREGSRTSAPAPASAPDPTPTSETPKAAKPKAPKQDSKGDGESQLDVDALLKELGYDPSPVAAEASRDVELKPTTIDWGSDDSSDDARDMYLKAKPEHRESVAWLWKQVAQRERHIGELQSGEVIPSLKMIGEMFPAFDFKANLASNLEKIRADNPDMDEAEAMERAHGRTSMQREQYDTHFGDLRGRIKSDLDKMREKAEAKQAEQAEQAKRFDERVMEAAGGSPVLHKYMWHVLSVKPGTDLKSALGVARAMADRDIVQYVSSTPDSALIHRAKAVDAVVSSPELTAEAIRRLVTNKVLTPEQASKIAGKAQAQARDTSSVDNGQQDTPPARNGNKALGLHQKFQAIGQSVASRHGF